MSEEPETENDVTEIKIDATLLMTAAVTILSLICWGADTFDNPRLWLEIGGGLILGLFFQNWYETSYEKPLGFFLGVAMYALSGWIFTTLANILT